MPLALSSTQQEEIFYFIKKIFSDFHYFETLLASPIRQLIHDCCSNIDIDASFVSGLKEQYLSHLPPRDETNESKEQKEIFEKMSIILTTTVVYLFSFSSTAFQKTFTTIEELLAVYPQWREQLSLSNPSDVQELQFLLQFRNYMALALLLVPARHNKIFLLRVVERLEGSNNEYITGTGQRPAVTRRSTDIFHKESGTTMVKKTPKRCLSTLLQESNDGLNLNGLVKENEEPKKRRKIIIPSSSSPASSSSLSPVSVSGVPFNPTFPTVRNVTFDFLDIPCSTSSLTAEDLDSEAMTILLNEFYTESFTEVLLNSGF